MTLSRERIVDAALRILDADGPDGLSMRRLGAELDAGAASIYWHVGSKEQLLDLVADRVLGEVLTGMAAAETWRDWMEAFARSLRRVLRAHRGSSPIVGRRATTGPNAIVALEGLLPLLAGDGFDAATAILASTTLVAWTGALVEGEANGSGADPEAAMAAIGGTVGDKGSEKLAELLAPGAMPTADERFDYGLGVLLDGIEARRRGGRGARRA